MSEQSAGVGRYFDQISEGYRDRYGSKNPFHSYFFTERLDAATDGFRFDGKTVLDIGAGTGALYDILAKRGADYYACDISEKMLEQSAIPANRAFIGKAHEIAFPIARFDFIFLLGVTTYQSPVDLAETWRFIGGVLAPGGTAVVSFTNRRSLDRLLRGALRVARPFFRSGVLNQSFATFTYCTTEVADATHRNGLSVKRTAFLNHAFSPFNTLLPRPSVTLAKWIARQSPRALLSILSADFIAFIERAD